MAGNKIYVQGSYIDVHDNENVYLNVDKAEVNMDKGKPQEKKTFDKETLGRAILKVQQYFWGAASYAVIFCVCRDKYGYPNNMSQFERDVNEYVTLTDKDFHCKEGTISNTFRTNPYMKLSIDKWQDNGAKKRALLLKDTFADTMEDLLRKE